MNRTMQQMFWFGVVGLANTLSSYSVFALLLYLGAPYPIATLIGATIGLLVGFALTGGMVFRESQGSFPRYLLVFLAICSISIGVQAFLAGRCNKYLAGALALCMTVPVSFFLNKAFVFSKGQRLN